MFQSVERTAELLRQRFPDDLPAMVEDGFSDTTPLVEMALEALCEWHIVDPDGGWLGPVDWFWDARGWRPGDRLTWSRRAFASHEDALARAREDERIARAFVEETALMASIDRRDDEDLVYVWDYRRPEPRPLACDYMHEFASRLASAAALGGDAGWFDVAVHQFLGYAKAPAILRPACGIRGATGATSRGHTGRVVARARLGRAGVGGDAAVVTGRSSRAGRFAVVADADARIARPAAGRGWDVACAARSPMGRQRNGDQRNVADRLRHRPGRDERRSSPRPLGRHGEQGRRRRASDVDARDVVIHRVDTTPGLGWDEAELRLPAILYACLGARLLGDARAL